MATPDMPRKLLVVILLLSLNLAFAMYHISVDTPAISDYLRIGFNGMLLFGLLRGQEWARILAKVTAILTLVGGAVLLMQVIALGGMAFAVPQLGVFLYGLTILSIFYGVFLLWCMNQQDVIDWLMAKSYGEV